ncbi:MAG TPA: glucose-1-phosphate cytidylyltransferase [Hanamia sp.]|nr:glucose-1-phosphate cytidylyltransferase [Hanamia sp.]
MKVVILAGGLGTRIAEESHLRPKPMVEIGGKPILWHIMKNYSHFGFNEFIICCGYKGNIIKEYFLNYFLYNSDITVELRNNKVDVHFTNTESFKVTLVDTGIHTNTAGRIQKIQKYVVGETFMLTYGDGVSDINLNELVSFHQSHGKLATLTSIQLPGRFGSLETDENSVVNHFKEKPAEKDVWINGGYFVLNPGIFNYLKDDMETIQWEREPLEQLASDHELVAYKHRGFWKCMDAMRDKIEMEQLWESNQAKWKSW